MLLSLPLFSCSFNFATVNLDGSKKISRHTESGELMLETSILDSYASRNDSLSSYNHYQFLANYTIVRGKLSKQSTPVVVRTFPTYFSNPQGENYAQFCRIQLLKYQPWSNRTHHTWQSDSSDDTYIISYHRFLETQDAKDYIPHFAQDLYRAQQYIQQEVDDDLNEVEPIHQQDDWMLCTLNNSSDSSYDWCEYAQSLPQHK